MEALLLDSLFKTIYILDTYKSFIWTDRYNSYGDFELVTTPSSDILSILSQTKYVAIEESEHMMFYESKNIVTDLENGDELTIKGRSLEALLDRRIVWDPTICRGNFQTDGIYLLLNENIYNATPVARQIPKFVWSSSSDEDIVNMTISEQYFGEIIYNVIKDLCFERGVGFKIIYNPTTDLMVFSLYNGVDRSFNQTDNPYVLFSNEFDNLITAEYIWTDQFLKTVAKIAGEKGIAGVQLIGTAYDESGGGNGLNRREMFKNGTDIKRIIDGVPIDDATYVEMLVSRGKEELAKAKVINITDGQVDSNLYSYREDYNIGDIVQVIDNYGNGYRSRIVEMVFFQDLSGYKSLPIFSTI